VIAQMWLAIFLGSLQYVTFILFAYTLPIYLICHVLTQINIVNGSTVISGKRL
jgi:hypothetical protein